MKVWAIISSSIDAITSGTDRCPRIRRAARTVTAGAAAIFVAMARTSSSKRSGGTTRETTPCPSASSAPITRPVSTMSAATP